MPAHHASRADMTDRREQEHKPTCAAVVLVLDDRWGPFRDTCHGEAGHNGDHWKPMDACEPKARLTWPNVAADTSEIVWEVTKSGHEGLGDLLSAAWEPFSVSEVLSDNQSGARVRTTFWLRRPVGNDGAGTAP